MKGRRTRRQHRARRPERARWVAAEGPPVAPAMEVCMTCARPTYIGELRPGQCGTCWAVTPGEHVQ